jgi:peptide/nickel transport system substrate-binding protein
MLHASHIPTWEHLDFGLLPVAYDDGYQIGIDRPDFFADVRTRRAIAYCIDRQHIVDTVFFGLYEVADNYLAPAHPLYAPSVSQYPFDPATGKALLEKAGWHEMGRHALFPREAQGIPNIPDGTPFAFTLHTTNSTLRQQAAQLMAEDLAQCGIQVALSFEEPDAFFADGRQGTVFGRNFEMAEFAWLSGVTPPCNLFLSDQIPGYGDGNWIAGDNNTGYTSPAFDEACRLALSLLPGQSGYEDAHHLAQQIITEDLPVIPLYFRFQLTASRPDFCGHVMDPTARSDFWNLESYNYGDDCPGG